MKLKRRTFVSATAAALAGLGLSAFAEDKYPSRAVKLVVPSVPGGATDIIGRATAGALTKRWPQPVVVDNRPGAGTSLGAELVSKASPDGYTLLVAGIASHAINPVVYKNLGYDPITSFTPITLLGVLANVLVVHPSFPARNMKELIEVLRANPGKYSYASIGNGTSPHLSAELLWQMTGVKVEHIPYKGSAPAMADLLGGQVPMLFDNISASVPHVQAGKIRALGVTTAARSPSLPEVPTFAESGIDGYEVSSWAGLVGPAGMPPAIVKQINSDTVAGLQDPEVVRLLLGAGVVAKPTTPEEFASFISSQNAKFREIAQRANLHIG